MKRVIGLLLGICLSVLVVRSYTIEAGVSVDKIPKTLFGAWQVEGQLIETNSARTFKPTSMDLWNLYRVGNVLTLENPFNGAKAEVGLKSTEGNLVVFTKTSDWDNRVLRDIVSIRIEKDTFSGINDVSLETLSIYDGHVLKKETARYRITGKKLSGQSFPR